MRSWVISRIVGWNNSVMARHSVNWCQSRSISGFTISNIK
jgi:hypothetical protein